MDEGKLVPKVWGLEWWFTNGPLYCGKRLLVQPGYVCSLHEHRVKDETFIVLEGKGFIQVGTDIRSVKKGDFAHIPPGTPHCFGTNRNSALLLVEISTHHDDADVVRHTNSRALSEPEIQPEPPDSDTLLLPWPPLGEEPA